MHHPMTMAAPARTVTTRRPAVAVKSDVKTGHDIAYVTRGHASGCTGAMAYYTSSGEPPGTWEGRGTAALGVSVRISVGHVKARLLRRLGRISEAKAMNDDTPALATGMPGCPDRILQELYGDAALFARDLGDSSAAYRHEMTALEIVRRNVRDRPDVQDIRRLVGAADGAIEGSRLGEADALIAEAELAARAKFGVDSLVYASVLVTRGRLRFEKREYKEALNDLERAATMLRNGSPIDHLKLPPVLVHLAQSAQFLGDRQKARLSIEEAYDIDLALYGPDHPETRKDREIMISMKLLNKLSGSGKTREIKRKLD
jgi:tetratricopeptide (TPR) repeat protein